MNAEKNPTGYGYELTTLIRENLMWQLNLPLKEAQEIAEKISAEAYYANWLVASLPDGTWKTFERASQKEGGK